MSHLALDIGGANIKLADGHQYARSESFALWKHPAKLAEKLAELIEDAPPAETLLATMTGELADCFPTKRDGVRAIVRALVRAAQGRTVRIYGVDGALVEPSTAVRQPRTVAAANWHPLARLAGRYAPADTALLLDIGSTTCDVIPIVDGQPAGQGSTDTERLLAGELVYTGVERTSISAVLTALPYRQQQCPVAAEWFATTGDAYLLLGEIDEQPQRTDTADGRPATREMARDRLARCLCADRETFTAEDALAAAGAIHRAQRAKIAAAADRAIARLKDPPGTVVISGQGEFLARQVLEAMRWTGEIISLRERLGEQISCCATAYALAVLAKEDAR